MITKPVLEPQADNSFRLIMPTVKADADLSRHVKNNPYDFEARGRYAVELIGEGEIERALVLHFEGLDLITDVISEDDPVVLDWEWEPNRTIIEFVGVVSSDLFLLGDFDPAAGVMEYLLDMDPEDHIGISSKLAFCYVALGDFDSFEDILQDLSDKDAETALVCLWAARHSKDRPLFEERLAAFKRNHTTLYNEFIADDHELSPEMLIDINSERPSRQAVAKDIWFKYASLWEIFPQFITSLKESQN